MDGNDYYKHYLISYLVISDTIDGIDHLIACFPYCASAVNDKTSSRCIPKSSRCKNHNLSTNFIIHHFLFLFFFLFIYLILIFFFSHLLLSPSFSLPFTIFGFTLFMVYYQLFPIKLDFYSLVCFTTIKVGEVLV